VGGDANYYACNDRIFFAATIFSRKSHFRSVGISKLIYEPEKIGPEMGVLHVFDADHVYSFETL
jgi:hypothetical protein